METEVAQQRPKSSNPLLPEGEIYLHLLLLLYLLDQKKYKDVSSHICQPYASLSFYVDLCYCTL